MITTQYGNEVTILGIFPDDNVLVKRLSDGREYAVHVGLLKADGGSAEVWDAIKQTESWKRNNPEVKDVNPSGRAPFGWHI